MIQQSFRKRNIIIIIIFLILVLFSQRVLSEKIVNQDKKSVYLIIINRLTLTDIEKMTFVRKLANQGSIGLMNTRGANGYDGSQGYITINTSKRAVANKDSGLFFNINPRLVNEYKRRTGQDLKDSQIINTNIFSLIRINRDIDFSPSIGALGDNLHLSGYKTAVFGNSDTADSHIRTNCLIATDSNGRIDYGNVDDILTTDEEFCYGYRTDYKKIYNEVIDVSDKAHLIVIETGDLNRLNSCKENMSKEMFTLNRDKVLSKIDNFIRTLVKDINKSKSLVLIISPNREESYISVSKLSPIILWGSDIETGIVTSGTTRRKGLVSNVDIAPTITSFLQASNIDFIGQPIITEKKDNSFTFVKKLSEDINSISQVRNKILKTYNVIVIIIPLISLLFLFFIKKMKTNFLIIIKGLLLSCIFMPLGFLLIPTLNVRGYFIYYLIVLIFVFLLNVLVFKIGYRYGLFFSTSLTIVTITADLLMGGNLIKSSVLGYDPIIGARYFGIGNEFLGVLLGTITFMCGSYLEMFKRHFYILAIMVIITVLVLHPNFGANFGGSIALIVMSMVFYAKVANIRISLKTIVIFIIILVVVFVTVILLDSFLNKNPSHLGKAFSIVIQGSPLYIFEILSRKLSMNIKLITITVWSKTLYFSLFYIFLSLVLFKDTATSTLREYRFLATGFISAFIGSIVGFLVNDSGVIMASISIIYITNYLLYVTIIEIENMQ